jgi:hypothetical protein
MVNVALGGRLPTSGSVRGLASALVSDHDDDGGPADGCTGPGIVAASVRPYVVVTVLLRHRHWNDVGAHVPRSRCKSHGADSYTKP